MSPTINKKLLPVKIHNFLRYGACALAPFLPVIVRQKGVSPEGVGFIWSFFNICNIFTFLTISNLADRFSKHKFLFLYGLTSIFAGLLGIYYIPNFEIYLSDETLLNSFKNIKINTRQIENGTFLEICSENINLKSPCLNENLNNSITSCNIRCELSNEIINSKLMKNGKENLDFALISTNMVNGDTCIKVENIKNKLYYSNKIYPEEQKQLICMNYYNLFIQIKPSVLDFMKTCEFWLLLLFIIMFFCGMSICMTMVDTATFEILQDKRHKYGFQRLFGSLAVGIMGITYGAVVDYFSQTLPERNYTSAFVLGCIMLMFAMIVGIFIEFKIPKKVKQIENGVCKIIGSPEVILFMASILMGGISQGSVWVLLFMYMEDVSLSWDKEFLQRNLLQGLAMATGCFLGEVPFNYLAGYIMKRVGHIRILAFNLSAYSLRLILYHFVKNPWYFIPIEVLHGLSFGIFCPVMFTYASILSTPGTRATLQGITSAFFIGGVSLSSLVCGVLYKAIGGDKLFLYIGLLDAAFVCVFLIAHILITKKKTTNKNYIEEEDDDQLRPLNDGELTIQVVAKLKS